MDFNQLSYFITIVESDFNLSTAAEKIHISQPALSKFINKFENQNDVKLFYRSKGRLTGLTKVGEIIYAGAVKVQNDYLKMVGEVENLSQYYGGTVNIGIPPLILTTLFAELIPELINRNPNIKFNIFEKPDRTVQKYLEAGKVDFGVLLHPNTINNKLFDEEIIHRDKLSVFLNSSHKLAQSGQPIPWEAFDEENMIIASNEFKVSRQLFEKLEKHQVSPIIKYETALSSYAIEMVKHSDYVTVLPRPLEKIVNLEGVAVRDLAEPIDWTISLTYPKKTNTLSPGNVCDSNNHELFPDRRKSTINRTIKLARGLIKKNDK